MDLKLQADPVFVALVKVMNPLPNNTSPYKKIVITDRLRIQHGSSLTIFGDVIQN